MVINHNIAALNTYRQLETNSVNGQKSVEKLSSGLRINRAGDDAAGLAISEKMRAQIRGLDQSTRNAQDGISLIQTAEGALSEVHSIAQRMRELANQSTNGTNTDDDRKSIQSEISQLKSEIDRIGDTTEFNTKKLLNGALKNSGTVDVSTNTTTGADVNKMIAACFTSINTFNATDYSCTVIGCETIMVDNSLIAVHWDQKLTASEQSLVDACYATTNMCVAQQQDIKTAFERVLNESIDEYNSANGANVQHVSVFVAGGKLNIKSGTTGTDSVIGVGDDGTGVISNYFTGSAATGCSYVACSVLGDVQVQTSLAGTEKVNFTINGVNMQTAALAASTAGTTSASTVAADIQSKIRTAVCTYNGNSGLCSYSCGYIDASQIFVTSKDAHYEVSSNAGAVTFTEQEGATTIKDLGLTSAQTEAGGNGGMTFQIGANKGQTLQFGINDMRSAALGIANVDVSTQTGAAQALSSIDGAIKNISTERSKLGALQNRLEHTINNLGTSSENLTAAESRIRDVDMAKEMMSYTKNNILSQAAQAMLAQANQAPQGVLQLLR